MEGLYEIFGSVNHVSNQESALVNVSAYETAFAPLIYLKATI